MIRALRGAWSRRGALATLALMTLVVVAGTLATLAYADASQTSRLVVAPLLLLGVVALPSIGSELARARRPEVGLARLRGVHGLRLRAFALLEPALAVALGLLAGAALGSLLARVVSGLAGVEAVDINAGHLAWSAAAALGGFLVVAISTLRGLREALVSQLSGRPRPTPMGVLGIFGALVVIVGAAVAVQRSRVDVVGEPDILVALAPALVGLSVAQVAIWLLAIGSRAAVGATTGRPLPAYLAARRLARTGDLAPGVRLVVASAVVAALAASVGAGTASWAQDQAKVDVGGAWFAELEGDAGVAAALALTEELDPAGDHLMAVLTVVTTERLLERRAYVEADRFAKVSPPSFWSGVDVADELVPRLAAARAPLGSVPADSFEAEFTVTGREAELDLPPRFRGSYADGISLYIEYVDLEGDAHSATSTVPLGGLGSTVRASIATPECSAGCRVISMSMARSFPGSGYVDFDITELELRADRLQFGDADLRPLQWIGPEANNFFSDVPNGDYWKRPVRSSDAGWLVRPLPTGMLDLELAAGPALPVLVAGEASEEVMDPSSRVLAPKVVASAQGLPWVGTAGYLADLATANVGVRHRIPSSVLGVVAGPGTPAALRSELDSRTTGLRPLDDVRSEVATEAGARVSWSYALVAAACVALALLGLGAAVSRQRREHQREVAAYRLLGLPAAAVRRAGLLEIASLGLLAAVATAVGGWAAVRLLVRGEDLVLTPFGAVVPEPGPIAWSFLAAAVAASAVALLGGSARRVRAAALAPATLREEDDR